MAGCVREVKQVTRYSSTPQKTTASSVAQCVYSSLCVISAPPTAGIRHCGDGCRRGHRAERARERESESESESGSQSHSQSKSKSEREERNRRCVLDYLNDVLYNSNGRSSTQMLHASLCPAVTASPVCTLRRSGCSGPGWSRLEGEPCHQPIST